MYQQRTVRDCKVCSSFHPSNFAIAFGITWIISYNVVMDDDGNRTEVARPVRPSDDSWAKIAVRSGDCHYVVGSSLAIMWFEHGSTGVVVAMITQLSL